MIRILRPIDLDRLPLAPEDRAALAAASRKARPKKKDRLDVELAKQTLRRSANKLRMVPL